MSSEVREALLRGLFRKTTHPFEPVIWTGTCVICATCGAPEGGEGHDV